MDKGRDDIKNLSSYRIFLVEEGNAISDNPDCGLTISTADFDELKLALPTSEWYIADRPHLQASFRGKVPLLAISPSTIQDISSFIEVLKLENRLLSRVAKDRAFNKGNPEVHSARTKHMTDRAYILPR